MKVIFPPMLAFCLAIALFSCAAEDLVTETEELTSANLEVYQTQDLVGLWELVSMESDAAIDLNGDKNFNTDILSETSCFVDMAYDFKANGTVATSQAKLHFNTSGITSCEKGEYSSTYTLENDVLKVSFEDKNGFTVSPGKRIKLTDNKHLLHITLSRAEASAYIKSDTGNSTGVINEITTIYRKK